MTCQSLQITSNRPSGSPAVRHTQEGTLSALAAGLTALHTPGKILAQGLGCHWGSGNEPWTLAR